MWGETPPTATRHQSESKERPGPCCRRQLEACASQLANQSQRVRQPANGKAQRTPECGSGGGCDATHMACSLRRLFGSSPPGPRCLLLGERHSGKTVLLCLAAVRAAAENGRPVLFLARRPLQSLPAVGRDPLTLKKVQFLYPCSSEELLKVVASLHERDQAFPSLILLDGLEEYLTGDIGQQEAALISALLVDTAAYFTQKLQSTSGVPGVDACGCCCHLLISMRVPGEVGEEAEEPLALSVVERYFPEICQLRMDLDRLRKEEEEDEATEGGTVKVFRVSFRSRQRKESDTSDEEWVIRMQPSGQLEIALATSSPSLCPESGAGKNTLEEKGTTGVD
ncbi:ATPase SWSAP1 [Microcaecilia unicolor]|uniref:ATPase SWSAP1 n=1 Tax=Microcaecilia unicolor TaxID=1415580 RepID=A0A6P7XHZ9_9AMPH|nr:ATPase SWSAP1 [Microcaecilia unicolor]